MQVMYERCAGLDVHKKTVVACVVTPAGQEIRTFSTMTVDLLGLADWLLACGCTPVAMESTGDYWKPVFNMLEGTFEVLLVNAQHVKAVPGRKTDVKDAAWLAELLQHGLLRASFIPPVAQRELRDLTRYRSTFIRERVTLINRVQKLLEDANIKLAAVASDIMGVSGRAMLAALLAGHTDPQRWPSWPKAACVAQRDQLAKALDGRVKPHHRFVLTELLCQIDSLDETIARFDTQIQAISGPFEAAIGLLDTIPGVARPTAEMIVAEIGTDMSRFPSADHLASWAGVAPGNHESAGKRTSGQDPPRQSLLAHRVGASGPRRRADQRHLSQVRSTGGSPHGAARSAPLWPSPIRCSSWPTHMIQRQEPYREAGPTFLTSCNRKTRLGGSSNAWNIWATA